VADLPPATESTTPRCPFSIRDRALVKTYMFMTYICGQTDSQKKFTGAGLTH
jgi:hypothetical protein